MKTRILVTIITIFMLIGLMTGCEKNKDILTIGISQFADHVSLDNCREGFLDGLLEAGYVDGENIIIIYQNAQADMGAASTIAESFISQKVDMICGIATPSAMTAYNSCMETKIPVIYSAISDPVAAGLANEDGTSVGNVTGTSDSLPVSLQLEMIRTLLPEATKIGIIYTTSETNSISTLAEYEKFASDFGFEIISTGISQISEVELAAADMVEKVDCITNLTDNTLVSALQTVLSIAETNKIPVFGSEIEQVRSGCIASMGLDYYELGKQTGAMAAKVLSEEKKAKDLPYEIIKGASLYVNTDAAERIGMQLSEEFLLGASEVFRKTDIKK